MTQKKLSPQTKKVLEHLKKYGDISFTEAWDAYSVRSLPRRICDLKEAGHKFAHVEKRHEVTGQRYVRYFLLQEDSVAA